MRSGAHERGRRDAHVVAAATLAVTEQRQLEHVLDATDRRDLLEDLAAVDVAAKRPARFRRAALERVEEAIECPRHPGGEPRGRDGPARLYPCLHPHVDVR